ncbi:hypothetical protein [Thalassobellus citreus]|uniref:hypothetical protein n=1 Tax=Thalassobellus citreus TaxID=3367752 RepID=UPI00378C9905
MKLNWTKIEDRKPETYSGFNPPYISCIVFSCNPEAPQGGVIETCRWDVKNECWFEADIKSNWFLQKPYEITHFADDVNSPYDT